VRRLAPLLLALAALGQDGDPAPDPKATRLDETNREAAEHVVRTFADEGKAIRNQLRGLRKEDVIVVGGLFDFVQEILKAYGQPCTVVAPADLEYVPLDEPERKLFFFNCHLMDRDFPGSAPKAPQESAEQAARRLAAVLKEAGLDGDTAPGKAIRERFAEVAHFAGSPYSKAGLRRVGEAVKAGAWACSTDWAVLVWEQALPGTIRWTGHTTFEETVEVKPALAGRRHPLLDGAFPSGKARWWLETESYLFAVRGKSTPLVESSQLAARYGGNKSVVVLLEPGKGRVLHALSHTYLQRGSAEDASVMQRLLLNFMIGKSLQNHERDWARQQAEEKRAGR